MDPITAVGLASSSIQLADFMLKLISGTRSIYKSASGSSNRNETIEAITLQLQALMLEVSGCAAGAEGRVRVDRGIAESAAWCSGTAQELLDMLGELKRGEKTVWKSFRAAVKSARHGDRVEELFEAVGRMQLTLMTQLQFSLFDKYSRMTSTLQQIDKTNEKLGFEHAESLIDVRDSILASIRESEGRIRAALDGGTLTTAEPTYTTGIITGITNLICQKIKYETEQSFLSSLQFDQMGLRQASIKEAHSDTFEWIFQDSAEGNPAMQFPRWLKEGNGIFWVNGKAGSGKSTLMKFLSQNPHTDEMLETWAGDKQLAVARYYFWNAGSRLQRTREGMIQTLLFQLLRACPDAIPFVRKSVPEVPASSRDWAMSALKTAAMSLVAYPLPKRICMFIDGLDEVEGDLDDLIELIENLASSDKVKICCSSRPWTSFVDAFGQGKDYMLKLEDLTARDIGKYVTDSFQQHKRFHKHAKDARFLTLVEEIVSKASGVFLWVTLVVKSLLEGLTHADRIVDLERRLKALPSDLESLFHRIIESVSPFYKQQSSELLLLMCCRHRYCFPAVFLDIMAELEDNPSVLVNGFNVETLGDPHDWAGDITRRLDARTKGLLELHGPSKSNPALTGDEHDVLENITRSSLGFLHRSVLDYLHTPDVMDQLKEHCRPDFQPYQQLVKASYVILISPTLPLLKKNRDYGYFPHQPHQVELEILFLYSRDMKLKEGSEPLDLLRTAAQRHPVIKWSHPPLRSRNVRRTRTRAGDSDQSQSFLSIAARHGLSLYIAQALREDPGIMRKQDKDCWYSPLFNGLIFATTLSYPGKVTSESDPPGRCSSMIRVLFEDGADISRLEGDTGHTAWSLFLEAIDSHMMEPPTGAQMLRDADDRRRIFAEMISHGADLRDKNAEKVIRKLFSDEDVKYLYSLAPGRDKEGNKQEEN